jgi:hypothetical protein
LKPFKQKPLKPNPMKRLLYFLPLVLFSASTFTASSKNTIAVFRNDEGIKPGKNEDQPCIVYKKDGSSTHYSSLKLVTGIFTSPHLLADGKIKILPGEIIAYQVGDLYVMSQIALGDTHPSKVATDVLPGFAKRISAGTINVYIKQIFNGAKAVEILFMQCGNQGIVEPFQYSVMESLIKEQPQALSILKANKKQVDSKTILAVAEAYNSSLMITMN